MNVFDRDAFLQEVDCIVDAAFFTDQTINDLERSGFVGTSGSRNTDRRFVNNDIALGAESHLDVIKISSVLPKVKDKQCIAHIGRKFCGR